MQAGKPSEGGRTRLARNFLCEPAMLVDCKVIILNLQSYLVGQNILNLDKSPAYNRPCDNILGTDE